MAKAVMLVANSDRKNTIAPTERLARKKSSVFACDLRKARLPITPMITR